MADAAVKETGPAKTITSFHIFPAKYTMHPHPPDAELSMLMTTESSEVYGKGPNCLFRSFRYSLPMVEGGTELLSDFEKVELLSGLKIKKIAVGLGFGVGLTEAKEVFIWGKGPKTLNRDAIIMYEIATATSKCQNIHRQDCVVECQRVGGTDLALCRYCQTYLVQAVSMHPPTNAPVKVFAKFGMIGEPVLHCSKCSRKCGQGVIGKHRLNYCKNCDLFLEVETPDQITPQKWVNGIADVDCGLSFICCLTKNRELKIIKWKRNCKGMIDSFVRVPDHQPISSFSCGSSHIGAITDSGDLYIYGDVGGGIGQSTFETITMKLATVPAAVHRICCSNEMTACLLSDSSILVLWKETQQSFHTIYSGVGDTNVQTFADIVGSVKMVDRVFLKTCSSSAFLTLAMYNGELEIFWGNPFHKLFVAQYERARSSQAWRLLEENQPCSFEQQDRIRDQEPLQGGSALDQAHQAQDVAVDEVSQKTIGGKSHGQVSVGESVQALQRLLDLTVDRVQQTPNVRLATIADRLNKVCQDLRKVSVSHHTPKLVTPTRADSPRDTSNDLSPQLEQRNSDSDASQVPGSLVPPLPEDPPRCLYGQTFLSDLTLKLADGEFPVHRSVLYSASNYFRNVFTNNDSAHQVLDMSSYNPRAYRALLQFFYGTSQDVLSLKDLTDLHLLAKSYDEPAIIEDVFDQLKSMMSDSFSMLE